MAQTPKGRALGNALRRAREDQKITLRAFAAQIDCFPGDLSRWENGERTPRSEDVARILTALRVPGDRYKDIMTLARGIDAPLWVSTSLPEQRQQLAAYLEFERKATTIIEVAPLLIPGLLQTEDYARAIMTAPGVPPGEIEERVALRVGRRPVIEPPLPAEFRAFVGQGAFYQAIGGRSVMAAQVRHLIGVARRPNVDLRVVPYGAGWNPALEGAFSVLETGRAAPVVFLENRTTVLCLHRTADVREYQRAADTLLDAAMSREHSLMFLADTVTKMETPR